MRGYSIRVTENGWSVLTAGTYVQKGEPFSAHGEIKFNLSVYQCKSLDHGVEPPRMKLSCYDP